MNQGTLAPGFSKTVGKDKVERFYVRGEEGAVQFVFWREESDWHPQGTGWDLGYHSPVPLYEGQATIGSCGLIGLECYYDGSGLAGSEMGEEYIWSGYDDEFVKRRLMRYYRNVFMDRSEGGFGEVLHTLIEAIS